MVLRHQYDAAQQAAQEEALARHIASRKNGDRGSLVIDLRPNKSNTITATGYPVDSPPPESEILHDEPGNPNFRRYPSIRTDSAGSKSSFYFTIGYDNRNVRFYG